MPNTMPVIDNGSILDFTKRRAKDKSQIKIYPLATLTKYKIWVEPEDMWLYENPTTNALILP